MSGPGASAAPRRARPPRHRGRIGTGRLALATILVVAAWLALEGTLGRPIHPRYLELVEAARTVQHASTLVLEAKERAGIAPPPTADPNRTGLVGPEWSELVTTQGHLPAKRTATNPDFAAAIARELAALDLEPDDRVVVVMSGSFPGANIAALAAIEALDLDAVPVTSLGASMWGAADPGFTWMEIERLLWENGVLESRSRLGVLGGDMAIGRDLAPELRAALLERAEAYGLRVVRNDAFDALVAELDEAVTTTAGGSDAIGAFVNVGGSMIALGTCRGAHRYAPGLHRDPLPCGAGTPGLMVRFSERGVPVLHLLDMQRLAIEFGLPYDPVPLPRIGDDRRIYGVR